MSSVLPSEIYNYQLAVFFGGKCENGGSNSGVISRSNVVALRPYMVIYC